MQRGCDADSGLGRAPHTEAHPYTPKVLAFVGTASGSAQVHGTFPCTERSVSHLRRSACICVLHGREPYRRMTLSQARRETRSHPELEASQGQPRHGALQNEEASQAWPERASRTTTPPRSSARPCSPRSAGSCSPSEGRAIRSGSPTSHRWDARRAAGCPWVRRAPAAVERRASVRP